MAFAMLGNVDDEPRSDCRKGKGPDVKQVAALVEVRQATAKAKAPLDRAGIG